MTSQAKISVYLFIGYVMLLFCQVANAQSTDTTRNNKPYIKPLSGKNKDHVEVEKHEFHEQIESRVLFNGGRNTPNEIGMEHLNFIISGLKKDIDKYEHLYPQDKIVLKLEISGYSDAKPFYANQSDGERKTLNAYLAKKRAYYISNSIKKGLHSLIHGVEQGIDVKGEELPPYYSANVPEDPQRRMCIVTVLAYSMPVDSFATRNANIVAINHDKAFVPDALESQKDYLALNLPKKTKKYRAGGKLTASNPMTNPNFSKPKTKKPTPVARTTPKPTAITNPIATANNIVAVNNGAMVYTKTNALVQFRTGWHTANTKDYQYLQQLIKEIKEKVATYRRDNGQKPMVIQLDVRGYADKQGYYYNQPIAQRQQQNKLLSQRRAKNIGVFLQKFLKSQSIKVELKTQGLGEELPPGVTDGAINDPSRRTCLASIRVVEGQMLNSR